MQGNLEGFGLRGFGIIRLTGILGFGGCPGFMAYRVWELLVCRVSVFRIYGVWGFEGLECSKA